VIAILLVPFPRFVLSTAGLAFITHKGAINETFAKIKVAALSTILG